jgi:DNA-binding transcriptional MerR regulator
LVVTRAASHTATGYRFFGENEGHTLRFIGRPRNPSFSLDEIAELFKLWQNRRRASADVGFAKGAGTAVAMNSAQRILVIAHCRVP